MRRTQYLFVNERLRVTVDEASQGPGSTITAKICASDAGVPAAIGTLTVTASTTSGTPPQYVMNFSSTTLTAELAAYLDARVFLHVSSPTNDWYEIYPMQVTNRDPDNLPVLLA
jgi:hypothetical protein